MRNGISLSQLVVMAQTSIPQNHGPPTIPAPSVRDRVGIETPTAREAHLSLETYTPMTPLITPTAADEILV